MSPAIAAQLRGGSAQCSLVNLGGISDSLDLTVTPFWSVPPSWISYEVHLVNSHLDSVSGFNQTTQQFTIPDHAILLNNVTANSMPYTLDDFWASHPGYDGDVDIEPLASGVSLLVTGITGFGNIPGVTQQVFSVLGVQRLPATSQIELDSVHIVDPEVPVEGLTFTLDTVESLWAGGFVRFNDQDVAGYYAASLNPTISFRMNSTFTGGGGVATISATGWNQVTGLTFVTTYYVSFVEGSTFTSPGSLIEGAIDMSINGNVNPLSFRFVVTVGGVTSDPIYLGVSLPGFYW